MYAQFQSKEYETAAASAEQFIKLYPNNPQADYTYYVRGVANMQAGQNALVSLAGLNQAHGTQAICDLHLAVASSCDSLPKQRVCPDAAANELHL